MTTEAEKEPKAGVSLRDGPVASNDSLDPGFYAAMAGARCNGGNCDKAKTCTRAIEHVYHYGHRICAVSAGSHCGYYRPAWRGYYAPD